MDVLSWQLKHGVSSAAMAELHGILLAGLSPDALYPDPDERHPSEAKARSEAYQQSLVRLEVAQQPALGVWLTRNNVGGIKDQTGRVVRFGLGNESAAQNKVFKSSDLIGIRKRLILPQMVGSYIGQFVGREMKHEGWVFDPKDEHEIGQNNFNNFINSMGGDACFCTGPGSFI
jgi:hypothetical protein